MKFLPCVVAYLNICLREYLCTELEGLLSLTIQAGRKGVGGLG